MGNIRIVTVHLRYINFCLNRSEDFATRLELSGWPEEAQERRRIEEKKDKNEEEDGFKKKNAPRKKNEK